MRVLLLGLILLMPALSACYDDQLKERTTEAKAKQNLHVLQLGLARYGVDNDGMYPEDVGVLISALYMSEFPENPYTRRPMRPVGEGEQPIPGDFLYRTLTHNGKRDAFSVSLYGKDSTVILELTSGNWQQQPSNLPTGQ